MRMTQDTCNWRRYFCRVKNRTQTQRMFFLSGHSVYAARPKRAKLFSTIKRRTAASKTLSHQKHALRNAEKETYFCN